MEQIINQIEHKGDKDSIDFDRLCEDSLPMKPVNNEKNETFNLDEINNLENLN